MRRAWLPYLLAPMLAFASSYAASPDSPRVRLSTNMGDIVLELDRENAPGTVENFLTYVNDGFYDGTIFHRVIDDFMIQGGGYTTDFSRKKTRDPIKNEADNGLKNRRGTIAMARTQDPHSASAQFFINVKDNAFLDFKAPDTRGWGYCVFGRVLEGMNVVDEIRRVPTGVSKGFRDVPKTTVIIDRAVVEAPG